MKKLLKSEIYKSHKQYTDPLVCTVYTKKSTITTKKKKHTKNANVTHKCWIQRPPKLSVNQPLVVIVTIFCYFFSLFSFHLQLFLKKKKFTYNFRVNLVLYLSLNWVPFLYSKKATKPTLLALKTSPAFIINPPHSHIAKPKTQLSLSKYQTT